MFSSLQVRTKRYKHQVFTKLTDDQERWLTRAALTSNRKVAEVLRDFVQAAIVAEKSGEAKPTDDSVAICQEMLQTMRMELVTIGDCLMNQKRLDVRKMSDEAESVAAAELIQFRARREQRINLARSLGGAA